MDDAVAPTAGSGRTKGLGDLKALRPTLMGKSIISCLQRSNALFCLLCNHWSVTMMTFVCNDVVTGW